MKNVPVATKYKKLTAQELATFGITVGESVNDSGVGEIREAVKQYYPKTAYRGLVIVNSEYNDSTYDNTVAGVVVFDKAGNEVVPLKGHEITARRRFAEIHCISETRDSVGDIPFFILLPDLYIISDEE